MTRPIPYPLDYQLTLRRVIDERLEAARATGVYSEATRMEHARTRLHDVDFGACSDCGATISYFQILADPALQRCPSCTASDRP
jgi:RNA polymerase-binding transcription factor DksA